MVLFPLKSLDRFTTLNSYRNKFHTPSCIYVLSSVAQVTYLRNTNLSAKFMALFVRTEDNTRRDVRCLCVCVFVLCIFCGRRTRSLSVTNYHCQGPYIHWPRPSYHFALRRKHFVSAIDGLRCSAIVYSGSDRNKREKGIIMMRTKTKRRSFALFRSAIGSRSIQPSQHTRERHCRRRIDSPRWTINLRRARRRRHSTTLLIIFTYPC